MPYIKEERRKAIISTPILLATNSGELNYTLTRLCRDYFKIHGENYQAINDVVGALEGCKAEFTRRITNPFEDKKIKENGDCY